jgi:hypothetical protein
MPRPSRSLKTPSVVRVKRQMAKAHLSVERPSQRSTRTGEAVAEPRPSIAEIIDEYHDKSAKTIRSKKGR